MPDVKRKLMLVTEQKINPKKEGPDPNYPMRNWSVEVHIVDETQASNPLAPATCFEKVQYILHETFGKRAKQTKSTVPFRIEEEGWGEFDMQLVCTPVGGGASITIMHDLNFQSGEKYESEHPLNFKNPKPELLAVLRQTGSVPEGAAANGTPSAGKDAAKKRSRVNKSVDMDKLAEGLQKLNEEELLKVVQMVHDHRTAETYAKNDVENGEFHVDLYTLPDNLIKMLMDLVEQNGLL